MPRARQQRRRRAKTVKRAKVRVVKGHLTLKVAGYPGLHRFGASQLIQFVPLNKIKVAAKKILVQFNKKGVKKSRSSSSSSSSSSSKRKRSRKRQQQQRRKQ
jgi:uncharacterized membrane protein